MPTFATKDKLLVLRHSRLRRIPPAWNETEYLQEKQFPVLVVEFGNLKESQRRITTEVPRVRISNPWAAIFPLRLRPLCIFVGTFIALTAQFLTSGRPRLLIAHGLQEEILALGLGALFRIPFAIHAHEIYDKQDLSILNQLFLKFEGLAFRNAAFLIFPERTRERLYRARHRFSARSFLVYNCPRRLERITPRDLKAKFNLPHDAKIVGYWGGIGELNAIESMIRALCLLPHFYFVIWGWGEKHFLQKLKAIAKDIGVLDRVIFAGEMETTEPDKSKQKWEQIAGLDIGYCVYDTRENLRARYQATASNKLMEALAVGVPVLTSSSFDFRKIVEGEQVGVCAAHLTAAAIAGAIRDLIDDESGYEQKKRHAIRLHQRYFHFEVQFQEALKEFYKYFELQDKTLHLELNPLISPHSH